MSEDGVLVFQILGPLEARRSGEPVALGGPKQRALLALLLLHAGEVVSVDRLIDELWGARPPAKAAHTVQVFVSRLRKALGGDAILTQAPGYLVRGEVDAKRFSALVAEAGAVRSAKGPEEALSLLQEALALWRGPPLAEFAYEPWGARHGERLAEERLAALEERLEVELELGRHAQAVPELEELARSHPLRERPHGLLMLALYRSGRQGEALEAYRQLRARLGEELGLAPSPELQALERQILRQDETLAPRERARLPEGTVTLLFTDIEGSTELLHELGPEAYANVLEEHRTLLRSAFSAEGGVEVDTQGDALFVVFARAQAALTAAAAAQCALAVGGVRVRMGIHTGEPLLRNGGYVGLDVHRAARIMSAGHGGQVLVSEATAGIAGDGNELRELGPHRLKDMTEPQRLFQLGEGEFPPLRSLNRTNLPIQPTALLGRDHELATLANLLDRPDVRLVTLTGPGGTGKTRLALQAAADAAEGSPDGVFWVSLAPIPAPELVAPAIARALDVRETPGEPLEETLRSYLSSRRLLLLLDNFEHVLEARTTVRDLLLACPAIRVLVTSRTTLDLGGEHVCEVPPLGATEAVELFCERAGQAGADVMPDEAVAAICDRLDRLPLAIELAAARARLLEPEALLERLERRLPLLKGASDLPARQQTLHATIAWSYDLLDEDEQALFRQLSIFAGSFTLESAEAVADADLWTVESLVVKSLVRRWGSGRLGLLETIREFAAEQLESAGEAERLRNAHADHYLGLARTLEPYLHAGPERVASIERLVRELDNFRAALAHLDDSGRTNELLELATALWRFWMAYGYFGAGRRWLERGLELAEQPSPSLQARAMEGLGVLCLLGGDFTEGERRTAAALELFRSCGDTRGAAESLNNLGFAAAATGDHNRGERLLQEAAQLARDGAEWIVLALVEGNLAELAAERGHFADAIASLDESAQLYERIGDTGRRAMSLATRAQVRVQQGELDQAARSYAAALESADAFPQRDYIAAELVGVAHIVSQDGQAALAAELVGAAEALIEVVGASWSSLTATSRELRQRVLAETAQCLGEPGFEAAWTRGRQLTQDEAVAKALAALQPRVAGASSP